MSTLYILAIIWAALTTILIVLLIIRGTLTNRESDQLFLDQAESHMEAEQVQIMKRVIDEGKKHVVFDMSGVTHIDSTGIGRFISSLNKLRQAGGSLRMAGAGGQVRDAFHVTRLDTIFQFDDDVDSSLKALG